MTVSVRPWAEISADLRRWNMVLTREAADWGDALAAEAAFNAQQADNMCARLAAVHTALDQYDTIASSGNRNMKAAEACVSAIAKAVGR